MTIERLTDQDVQNLATEMAELVAMYPDEAFTSLFKQAQETVLPEEKRYAYNTLQQRTKWSKKLQTALRDAGAWPGYERKTEEPQEETPVEIPNPSVSTLAQTIEPGQRTPSLMDKLYESI